MNDTPSFTSAFVLASCGTGNDRAGFQDIRGFLDSIFLGSKWNFQLSSI